MNPFFVLQLFAEGAAASGAEGAAPEASGETGETTPKNTPEGKPSQAQSTPEGKGESAPPQPEPDAPREPQSPQERYLLAREAHTRRQYALWQQQAEAAKEEFPDLDMNVEARNPQFRRLLHMGLDVGSAYLLVHRQEVLERSAREVEKRLAGRMMTAATRPSENGSGGQASAITRFDVASMSKADREAIRRRAARGERIRF